jgi:hypothetical protein
MAAQRSLQSTEIWRRAARTSRMWAVAAILAACTKTGASSHEGVPVSVSAATPATTSTLTAAIAKPPGLKPPVVTDSSIALGNLDSQIDGTKLRVARDPRDISAQAALVSLLSMRGQYTGKIADYDAADALSAEMLAKEPKSGAAHLARASTAATFHRFTEALSELDKAAALKENKTTIDDARASVYLAQGRYGELLPLIAHYSETDAFAQMTQGVVASETLRDDAALMHFDQAIAVYRDVSPFAVAQIDFQRATWLSRKGDKAQARLYFEEAAHIVPTYAHAAVHLAALSTAEEAVVILKPLLKTSDDPEVEVAYADALRQTGDAAGARTYADTAKSHYEALLAKHPEAFWDHAATFYLGIGKDPARAAELAKKNAVLRNTDASLTLWLAAAQTGAPADICDAAAAVAALPYASSELKANAERAKQTCVPRAFPLHK